MDSNQLYIDKVVNMPVASNETQSKSLSGGNTTTSYTFTFSPPVGYIAGYYTANLILKCTSSGTFYCETYISLPGTYRHLGSFDSSLSNTSLSYRCYEAYSDPRQSE